ncbi:hypothetical protein Ae201684P_022004 [Aphanomyces euteiches]|uniref:Uncharacterized protein n=1 Tax=Aphanomyces euteiches TaxID=100861 RepID=A0A6G0W7X6_9STRA|nr:hypothetical protein Ae201684_017857 [Aphanomyces euteiches]KAH9072426.1 hypothetical protein Ae201684P_022004 [Aphanomyces euteiches]KAH9153470.1 hypothetical protein AeRB84_004296 [Aphanomyces euteiches]
MSDELRRTMTTDEPIRVPAEEWDGMLATKAKVYASMYPLTPCMLTPYNTPHCNLTSLRQRLHQSQSGDSTHSSTSQPIGPNSPSSIAPTMPLSWSHQPPPNTIARYFLFLVAVCVAAPATVVFFVCSPLLLLLGFVLSPVWVPVLFIIWWSSMTTQRSP